MTQDEALETVNRILCIGAVPTVCGAEFKCWVPAGDGGLNKTYLDASECYQLGLAFVALSDALRPSPPVTKGEP